MSQEPVNERYRIGDFAEYMGVTTDFLKHYAAHGLLDVQKKANGYRYFGFDQSSRILEYMRLRNYGVNIKDLGAMLSAEDDEAVRLLDEKAGDLRREADRLLSILEKHERLKTWLSKRREKPVDWEIRDMPSYYFLPHTEKQDFIRDPRIYELLKMWSAWMPIAKSALSIRPSAASCKEDATRREVPYNTRWGMSIPVSIAKRYDLPVNDVVEETPPGKAFLYHFTGLEEVFCMERLARGEHPMFEKLASLGLKPRGNILLIVEVNNPCLKAEACIALID